jgi:hypothetical protein
MMPIFQPFVRQWVTPTKGPELWVTTAQGTATAEVQEFYLRTLCHWLIDQLPVRAFEELVPNLAQMREFYALPPASQSPQLPTGRVALATITTTPVREVELPDED